MAVKPLPSQEVLRQLLDYVPETGKLYWKERPFSMFRDGAQSAQHNAAIWNAKNAGREACSSTANGYLETSLHRTPVLAHRVIWKMVTGEDAQSVDHIDGDKSNNRFVNLRGVTQIENGQNQVLRKNNTSGVMGVYWSKPHNKWIARLNYKYKTIYIGIFETFDEAVAARRAAEREYGLHPNHGRAA